MDVERLFLITLLVVSCNSPSLAAQYHLLIRNGTIYDGSGAPPFSRGVAIISDHIADVGPKIPGEAKPIIDAGGKAVAPGFINMLSWPNESLIQDGRSQS